MIEQTVKFDVKAPKKHSVRYDTTDKNACVTTIYIKREMLGDEIPDGIEATFTPLYKV